MHCVPFQESKAPPRGQVCILTPPTGRVNKVGRKYWGGTVRDIRRGGKGGNREAEWLWRRIRQIEETSGQFLVTTVVTETDASRSVASPLPKRKKNRRNADLPIEKSIVLPQIYPGYRAPIRNWYDVRPELIHSDSSESKRPVMHDGCRRNPSNASRRPSRPLAILDAEWAAIALERGRPLQGEIWRSDGHTPATVDGDVSSWVIGRLQCYRLSIDMASASIDRNEISLVLVSKKPGQTTAIVFSVGFVVDDNGLRRSYRLRAPNTACFASRGPIIPARPPRRFSARFHDLTCCVCDLPRPIRR